SGPTAVHPAATVRANHVPRILRSWCDSVGSAHLRRCRTVGLVVRSNAGPAGPRLSDSPRRSTLTGLVNSRPRRTFPPLTSLGHAPITAPTGTAISCKGWHQEAALRMLMNNLDPAVAERPEELIVYGGGGKAARNWECYERIVATLRRLEN